MILAFVCAWHSNLFPRPTMMHACDDLAVALSMLSLTVTDMLCQAANYPVLSSCDELVSCPLEWATAYMFWFCVDCPQWEIPWPCMSTWIMIYRPIIHRSSGMGMGLCHPPEWVNENWATRHVIENFQHSELSLIRESDCTSSIGLCWACDCIGDYLSLIDVEWTGDLVPVSVSRRNLSPVSLTSLAHIRQQILRLRVRVCTHNFASIWLVRVEWRTLSKPE